MKSLILLLCLFGVSVTIANTKEGLPIRLKTPLWTKALGSAIPARNYIYILPETDKKTLWYYSFYKDKNKTDDTYIISKKILHASIDQTQKDRLDQFVATGVIPKNEKKCFKASHKTLRTIKLTNNQLSQNEFIDTMAPIAVYFKERTGFPASLILGIMVLESGYGQSESTKKNTNLYNITCATGKDLMKLTGIPASDKTMKCRNFTHRYKKACDKTGHLSYENGIYLIYYKYQNHFDATFDLIHRTLCDEVRGRWGVYNDFREVFPEYLNKKASLEKLVKTLKNYATRADYVEALFRLINNPGLDILKYDDYKLCKE